MCKQVSACSGGELVEKGEVGQDVSSSCSENRGTNTRFFLYKNKLYKDTQAEIFPKIKNKLRTIIRLKF